MATQNPQRLDLGKEWKKHRERAGKTTTEVEQWLHWYKTKASRVEAATRVPVPAEIDRFADLCKLADEERSALHALGEAARRKIIPSRVADFAQTYVMLEEAAVEIRYFDGELIYGLAQVEDYARALLATGGFSDLEERVRDRMSRQRLLRQKKAPQVLILLGEAALHRVVGSTDTLREQLRHLLDLMELSNVSIRVLPFSAGAHVALGFGFCYLRLGTPEVTRVYLEGFTDAVYVHEPAETEVYRQGFDQLWATSADDETSASILRRRITDLG